MQTRNMTADDLAAMPHGMGFRYELIEGMVIEMAAAGGRHGEIGMKVAGEIYVYLQDHSIGELLAAETGFYTRGDKRTVRAPNIAFIREEKLPEGGLPDGYLEIVPDLVVEVVSPNDRAIEVDQKIQEWLTFGVQMVLALYPSTKRMMIYRQGMDSAAILNAEDTFAGDPVLPGFERKVEDFFVN